MEALQSTHLYGRKLVVQYADETGSVEAMREKVQGNAVLICSSMQCYPMAFAFMNLQKILHSSPSKAFRASSRFMKAGSS